MLKQSFIFLILFSFLMSFSKTIAQDEEFSQPNFFESIFDKEKLDFSGRFKNRISIGWPESDSFYQAVNTHNLLDYNGNLRFDMRYYPDDWCEFEIHNETIYLSSDTRRKLLELSSSNPALLNNLSGSVQSINDRRRLFDLTMKIGEDDNQIFINRFDRLSLALFPSWGSVRIGRQAITWGNGFIFNPMDIFTPFAPTQLDRDYKQGEDAVSTQINFTDQFGDMQFLYVPRRNIQSHNLRLDQSSFAGKYHLRIPDTESELSIISGYHYEDYILGAGLIGYLFDTAWRINTTWTKLDDNHDSFFSVVANMDYSWVWWGLNYYGWIEFYYNGLGKGCKDYDQAVNNQALMDRLSRGEIFVRGRYYIDTQLRVELHPLVNFYITNIVNTSDPSGIIQPLITWDIATNFQLNIAATIYWGAFQTEYGGVEIPRSTYTDRQPTSFFAWLNMYF